MGIGDLFKKGMEFLDRIDEGSQALAQEQVDELLRFSPNEMVEAMASLIRNMPPGRWRYFQDELQKRSRSNPSYSKLLEAAQAIRKHLEDNGLLESPTGWGNVYGAVAGGAEGLRLKARKQVDELLSLPLEHAVSLVERSASDPSSNDHHLIEQELEKRSATSQVARYLLHVSMEAKS